MKSPLAESIMRWMVILALDTTTREGSVAVVRDHETLALIHGDGARTHGERLPEELDRALRAAGLRSSDLDLLAVASGPGAFTGLRIGLAAIQGFAMVLAIPTIGVSALDALAHAGGQSDAASTHGVATWMDAQRGEIFAAHYVRAANAANLWDAGSVPVVGAPGDVLRQLPPEIVAGGAFIGDGAVRYRTEIEGQTGGRAIVLDAPPLAPFIASIARARAARGEAGPPHALQPLYVRRPDAELAKGAHPDKASRT
jgi:tRNA threonylcarbamoyladenosine biosynthesis protein TsaB